MDKVVESGETEDYQYDVNGRLTGWTRDGSAVDLKHDSGDRLKSVTNSTTGNSTQYIYDGNGNRVKEIDGSSVKQYLVAPNGEVESIEVVTDGSGNVIGNYDYAGGSSPFMMLDASGNPVYYLTDAMGSVIGLADGSGSRVGRFVYDGFGNIRSESSSVSDVTGGDFRFQGQWRESESGLYYFHARDYDAKSGLFTSRDALDPNVNTPESFNPYGFVYNNPYIYSDPTGMFTINDLNVARIVDSVLESVYKNYQSRVARGAIDQAKGVVTDVLLSAFRQLVPFDLANTLDTIEGYDNGKKPGVPNWEDLLIENSICAVLNSSGNYKDHVWKDVSVSQSGSPENDGYPCGAKTPLDFKDSKPDFIIKKGGPKSTDRNPKAYLIGDAKINAKNIDSSTSKGKQFHAMVAYANLENEHQYVPVATYITIFGDEENEKKLKKRADKQGVELFVIDFFPQSKKK